jgi:hypothetical protein
MSNHASRRRSIVKAITYRAVIIVLDFRVRALLEACVNTGGLPADTQNLDSGRFHDYQQHLYDCRLFSA